MRRWTLLLLMPLALKGLATTYYMKPTGSDNNSGLDTAHAWATLAHAAGTASGLSAGDTVLIMNGRYTGFEQNVGVTVEVTGTPGHRIVFKAYPGHHPIFDGEARATTNDHWYHYGVLMHSRIGGSYTVWDSIDIRNIGDPETGDGTENGCFYVRAGHHITFKNCWACSTYGGGGNLCGGFMICDAEVCSMMTCTSYVHYWTGHWTGNQACYNVFSGADGSGEDVVIKNCYGHHATQGAQVKSYETPHTVIENSVFHDCNEGIMLSASRCVARFNVIYDCCTGIKVLPNYADQEHDSVYNNTLYMPEDGVDGPPWNPNPGVGWGISTDGTGHNTCDYQFVYNNIVWMDNGIPTANEQTEFMCLYNLPMPDTIYSDYNCFYDDVVTIAHVAWGDPITFSEWQALKHDLHSLNQDPLLMDPENNDFHLSPDSPCIGAGRDGADIGAVPFEGVRRSNIDRLIRKHKEGTATDEQVETLIQEYMEGE